MNQLTNGLPVFLRKSKKTPIVTLQVWVRTGSSDEKPNEAGVSHFIEHLLFKGTEKYKPGEIAQVVERAGGELNAYTSFDQTVFYVTVPKKNFSVACDVLSQMFSSPLFDHDEINNEREVVIEEIKMGLDQPTRVSSKMLFSQMFQGYPYADPVIGTQENIARITDEEIKDYFKERYQTKNMSLVCVGDIGTEEETLSVLEGHFSNVLRPPEKGEKNRKRSQRTLNENQRVMFQKADFEKDYFYLSWPVEGFLKDESIPYELLSLIMGQGESSYIYKKLKLEKGLCRSIGASYFGSPEYGIFVVSGVCSVEEKEKLFKEIPKTLQEFFELKDITEDIEKAQNIFESEQAYEDESISSQCRTIGDDWLYYNEFGATEERKNKVLKLTADDLNESARKILQAKPYLALLSKKNLEDAEGFLNEIENLKNIEVSFEERVSAKVKKETPKRITQPEIFKSWVTEKGSRVYLTENYDNDVISFKVGSLGGELLSSDSTQGLVSLFGSTWARATKGLKESEMSYLLDKNCSSLNAFSGKHSSGVSLSTLRSFFDDLSPLLEKVYSETVFDQEILNREIQSKLYMKQAQNDRPSSVAIKEFNALVFKNTFYERDSIGSEDYLKKATLKDLEDFLSKTLNQQRTYVVVGALGEDKVRSVVESIEKTADYSHSKNLLEDIDFKAKYEGGVKEIPSEKAQAHILLGYPGFGFSDERKIHLKLLTALLGGQGGRLFIELRDKASLAYSVAPIEQSAYFGGFFGGYIACDPSKKEKAIAMMKAEFKKCADSKMTSDELKWIKNQVLGQELMGLQRNSNIADHILFDTLYGLDALDYKKTQEKIECVSEKDLKETMELLLSHNEYLVTVG